MKNLTLLLFTLIISSSLYSQICTSSTEDSTYPAENSGFIEDVTSLVGPGVYVTVTNILENNYTFTAGHSVIGVPNNDYITITDTDNTILANGVSPLNYTIMPGDITTNTLRVHLYLDSSCNTANLNISLTLLNETVAPTTCQKPEDPRVSYRSDTRIDFSWSPPSVGDTPVIYDWEAVPTGNDQGVGVVDSGNVSSPGASATGLSSGTTYDFYIRSNCGANGNSDWLGPLPLTTNAGPPPANDFCSGATFIVQDTGKDVNSATEVGGTLLNTAGTDVDPENCDSDKLDNARDDVWYSFIAQTTDINITLNPMFNGILTLLSDCDASAFLDCSDIGTGNTTEQISYNGLSIGNIYYFRVYYQGFTAPNPNFTFKLWSSTVTVDSDGDGYSDDTDCDDSDDTINPGATEIAGNDIDENCDGNYLRYVDGDGDRYGSSSTTSSTNSTPGSGESNTNNDCNDSDAAINPGATEVAGNSVDENCDGNYLWYQDLDGDGYGSASTTLSNNSTPESGESNSNNDCDDTPGSGAAINPEATEVPYDGIDNDCNAATLDDDLDEDGFVKANDCDDSDPNVNPDATEILDNGKDDDCNPSTLDSSADVDDDGDGFTENQGDCNDTNPAINTSATEILYDGIDQNCNGLADDTLDADGDGVNSDTDCDDNNSLINTPQLYYVDADLDGFGSATTIMLCESAAPSGYSTNNTDCDDGDFDVNPSVVEIPNNGIDDDCDSLTEDTLAVDDFNYQRIRILPVPFKNELSIYLPNSTLNKIFKISLYDLLGKMIFNHKKQNIDGVLKIKNLENLQQGLYIIKILDIDSRKQVIKRVVKF